MKVKVRDASGQISTLDVIEVIIDQVSSSLSSSQPPASSSMPPVTSSNPPVTSSNPPVTSSQPPAPVVTGSFNVILTTKEVAGLSASNGFPTTVVVPLPSGVFQDTSTFTLLDQSNVPVPAQFVALNRHAAKDNSIRHVAIQFQPTLTRFSGANTGIAQHRLTTGTRVLPTQPVVVSETTASITLATGVHKVVINRAPFSVKLPTGDLDSSFYAQDGSIQKSFGRTDIKIEIEERGPMRAIVKASAPTINVGGVLTHGWAIRLYMYAGKPYVKLDFQLQNCDMTRTYSGPLNFDGLELSVPAQWQSTAVRTVTEVRTQAPVTVDPSTLPLGAINGGTSWCVIRNFQQMWPAAVRSSGASMIMDLWPRWGAQFINGEMNSSGLYALDDLQCVMKEVLIGLTSTSDVALQDLARVFQYHPVTVVPKDWYASTSVSLDMGGVLPAVSIPATDRRMPNYAAYSNFSNIPTMAEKMGWDRFGCDTGRRTAPGMAGSWPSSVAKFILSGDPADYYFAEDFAMAELNVMPEWFINYTYATNWDLIKPSENPYGGFSWRMHDGVYGYNPAPGYPTGFGQEAKPRDDQHGWFYHVDEAYHFTANPWIKDWYKGIAEFRRTRLNQKDPWPDMSARATGHALAHALQAYRITGDTALLTEFSAYLKNHVVPLIDPALGGFLPREWYPGEAMFQIGFLSRTLVTYLSEVKVRDPIAFDLLAGFVRWNLNNSRYGYYLPVTSVNAASDGTAMTMCDPTAWYIMQTNDDAVRQQLVTYVKTGIGGGQRPYVDVENWAGDWLGRWVTYLRLKRGGTL